MGQNSSNAYLPQRIFDYIPTTTSNAKLYAKESFAFPLFPLEIKELIFVYCDGNTLIRGLSRACKAFLYVCDQETIWKAQCAKTMELNLADKKDWRFLYFYSCILLAVYRCIIIIFYDIFRLMQKKK